MIFLLIFPFILGKGRVVFTYKGEHQNPSYDAILFGLAIDTAENLYVGLYWGAAILKINPR